MDTKNFKHVVNQETQSSDLNSDTRHDCHWSDEFALIKKILKGNKTAANNEIIHGPGDDACLLNEIRKPVITTDTQREGVHFELDWLTPEQIGNKAISVTLSDLAASYAIPKSVFINLGLPKHVSDTFAESIYRGVYDALNTYRCSLGGGNVSVADTLTIDIFAIGQGSDIFPLRSNAKPGYGLYTTGPLGISRGGLFALKKKDMSFPYLLEKFITPKARFDAAPILADAGVTCVTDISDGLWGDAGHIAESSRISITLSIETPPLHPEFQHFCKKYGYDTAEMMLSGGEDYELLFACPPDIFTRINKQLPDAFQVGTCQSFNGHYMICPEGDPSSFQHGNITP